MANNLLMLFKLDADTISFLSLIVSIVGAVAAIFAAFYANIAAFYAKKSATKRDLTRVEQNTQHAEHFSNKILSINTPIQPQEKQEASEARLSGKPHRLKLSGKLHRFRLSRKLHRLSRRVYPSPLRVKLWEKSRSNCS